MKFKKKYLSSIVKSEDRLLKIINDILDISKIESGKIELETEDFSFGVLVEEVVESFAVTAHIKNVELISFTSSEVPFMLKGDSGKIRQILVNIIGNAIKFTNAGEVLVKVEKEYEANERYQLKITVSDTGIGIPKEKIGNIFNEFVQADNTYTKRYQGTGLGLAISKRLVELMGGFIGVESLVGKGSNFFFTITLNKADRKYILDTEDDIDYSKLNILVIDDNKLNLEIIEKMLLEKNVNVITAVGGKEGLSILERNKNFDLIFLDVNMPQMEGFDVAERIRNKLKIQDIVTVMFTSVDIRDRISEFKKLKVNDYILKPIKRKDLFNFIKKVVLKEKIQNMELKQIEEENYKKINEAKLSKILVVEDDILNIETIVLFLEKRGYKVIVAENGQEAVELTEKMKFDMIIMDIQMPVLNGIEATKQIRQKQEYKFTPIIALTAYAMKTDKKKFLEIGMTDYIPKPVKSFELYRKIEKYLKRISFLGE